MLSTPSTGAPSGPGPGLIVSLAAWTWPGRDPSGREVAHILITHTPGRTEQDTAEAIEARMRRIADGLGPLARRHQAMPDLARCLHIVGGQVLLSFPGTRYRLRLPTRPSLTGLVARTGEAVLLLGLDALAQSANAARVDAYLDAALAADRLLFGRARTR
ncbi:hypothetical protein [Streptomyces sp. HUAS TT7]|uniref:hypothetical protein n=1 Tax=Streptomyces sp. HUAS TT7 TaxID=3447507 RepID=UPI003F660730